MEQAKVSLEQAQTRLEEERAKLEQYQVDLKKYEDFIRSKYDLTLVDFLLRDPETERETSLQQRVDNAQQRVDNAQQRVDNAQQDVRNAQQRVDNAQQEHIEDARKRLRVEIETDNKEISYLERAFVETYQDDTNVDSFLDYTLTCIDQWIKKKAPYPYFPLVQSSGYGKSRLLKELGEHKLIRMTSICLRPDNDTGFPLSNDKAIKRLDELKRGIPENDNPEDDTKIQYGQLVDEMTLWILQLICLDNQLVCDLEDSYSMRETLKRMTKEQNVNIVFSIDEARNIFGSKSRNSYSRMFRILRNALCKFQGIRFMCILTDTTSSITNFLQPIGYNPSERVARQDIAYLMPYLKLHTLDVMTLNQKPDIPYFWKLGRPLWYSLRKNMFATRPENIWNVVYSKLFCGQAVLDMKQTMSSESIAALIGVLTGVIFQSTRTLGENLLSSHLATLLDVHENRSLRYIMYVPEPALAVVAYEVFMRRMEHILDSLTELFLSELILEGKRGEFVACLILVSLRDSKMYFDKQNEQLIEEPLSHWLPKVYDGGLVKEQQQQQYLDTTYVNYLHFHPLESKFDLFQFNAQRVLKWAYEHAVGFYLPRNWPAADLLIPTRCDDEYSCVLIQVKNREKDVNVSFKLGDVFKSSDRHDTSWYQLKTVNIVMQLRNHIPSSVQCQESFKRLLKHWSSDHSERIRDARFGYLAKSFI